MTYLPEDSEARKGLPLATGLLDYFPAALAAVAEHSRHGNDKHNPGEPLNWSRGKSQDHADCIARHLIDRGTTYEEQIQGKPVRLRHSAALAWRALALLQEELEAEGAAPGRASKFPTTAPDPDPDLVWTWSKSAPPHTATTRYREGFATREASEQARQGLSDVPSFQVHSSKCDRVNWAAVIAEPKARPDTRRNVMAVFNGEAKVACYQASGPSWAAGWCDSAGRKLDAVPESWSELPPEHEEYDATNYAEAE